MMNCLLQNEQTLLSMSYAELRTPSGKIPFRNRTNGMLVFVSEQLAERFKGDPSFSSFVRLDGSYERVPQTIINLRHDLRDKCSGYDDRMDGFISKKKGPIPETAYDLWKICYDLGLSTEFREAICMEYVAEQWIPKNFMRCLDAPQSSSLEETSDAAIVIMEADPELDYSMQALKPMHLWYSKNRAQWKRVTDEERRRSVASIKASKETAIQQQLWKELCDMCGWETVEYHRYRDNRLLVLLRRRIYDEKCKCRARWLPAMEWYHKLYHGFGKLWGKEKALSASKLIPLQDIVTNETPDCCYTAPIRARPEMDDGKDCGITDGEKQDMASNVVLGKTQEEVHAMASGPVIPKWHSLSTTEEEPDFRTLTDRYLHWQTIEWAAQEVGSILLKKTLPLDFVTSSKGTYCSTPNFVPFNVHAYFRGDMEVKIQVNSNAFQCGMLLVSWLYGASSLYQVDDLRQGNVYSLVQQPHVCISAGASNEATLYIPYRYFKPYMRTKKLYRGTVAEISALDMGRLVVAPISRLRTTTAANSPKKCSVSLFVRFVNAKFTGMVDGTIAQPEMNTIGAVCNAGGQIGKILGTVSRVIGDVNCDNPPDTLPARFLVPINAQSWSHGTKTSEPINTLRLDGRRIGVGRSADIGYSETRIANIVSVFGLLKPILWRTSDASGNGAGYKLWSTAVHPQCDKDVLYKRADPGNLDLYAVPPCGVVSSMFCYWRGGLEYRFDFVATSKHTGRILVAYIPGISDGSNITLAQAKSSTHVVFSLNQGTNSFTFKVPYIADTMWWPRKYGGPQRSSDYIAPSCIVMFIVNPLIPMETVSQEIEILPYVRAAPDFEVSVPGQPSIGLGNNRMNMVPNSAQIAFKSGYYPVYSGAWRMLYNSQVCILRYGPVSDHVAQLTAPTTKVRAYRAAGATYLTMNCSFEKHGAMGPIGAGVYTVGYIVAWEQDGYNYAIPFPASSVGEEYAVAAERAIRRNGIGDPNTRVCLPTWIADTDYNKGQLYWYPLSTYRAQPEMDTEQESRNPMVPTANLPSTRSGVVTFGESFFDLKDLCRRYQLYWESTISAGQLRPNRRNSAIAQIPLLPHGLDLEPSLDNPIWNSMRGGHIPLTASGFRFFRGGLRMRIVITGIEDSIWVQHHPDRVLDHNSPKIGKDIELRDAYRNHSYAFHVQNMSVNRTIEVEIPFYQRGLYGSLNQVNTYNNDGREFGSLGDLVIGIEGEQAISTPIDVTVYYTLADDCSFNVFCGFPMMIFCDETYGSDTYQGVRIDEAELQMRSLMSTPSDFSFEYLPCECKAQPEMFGMLSAAASSVIGNAMGNIATRGVRSLAAPIKQVIKEEIHNTVHPIMKDIEQNVTRAAEEINHTLNVAIPQQALISSIGQFAQVALNPKPISVAIAIVTALAQFVTVSIDMLMAMQEVLAKYLMTVWNDYFHSSNDHQTESAKARPEGFVDDMNDKQLNGFLGMCFMAVTATLGLSIRPPKEFPNVMKGVKECMNVCNASVLFFKNNVDALVYMYKYALGESDQELKAKIVIEREYPHMKDWCDEVIHLLDPRNANAILHSTKHANRVFDACMYGSKLIQDNLDKAMPGGRVVLDLFHKICKLRDDIIELGNHPDVRFEAFPIWVSGPAGVGKSHMTNTFCEQLLAHIGYKTKECMIYWLALGQKYWNGIKNPPVIARDEAYAVGGQFTEEEIATHLAICSSSILNPPMAALSEKNKRLNPLIYYMNSNLQFPEISEARCPEAIYRRRKLMIDVDFTADIKARYPGVLDASALPPSETNNYKHLQFRVAHDPKNRNTRWIGPMSFEEVLRIAKERFKSHIERERNSFKQRMMAAYALDPDYDPEDNLNFSDGNTLSFMTLHEKYLMEKEAARDALFAPPPEEPNDTWIQSVLDKFAYLWNPPKTATGEMDEEITPEGPSNPSSIWYSDSERSMAEKIKVVTGLDRGAVLKMISGNMFFTDEDIKNFVISQDFARTLTSKDVRLRYSLMEKEISMLPDELMRPWRQCGFGPGNSGQTYRFEKTFLPHWSDVTGINSIRSYLYWLMRDQQYKEFARLLTQGGSAGRFKLYLEKRLKGYVTEEDFQDLISCNMDRIDAVLSRVDRTMAADYSQLTFLLNLMWALDKVVESDGDFCEHCKFWVEHLHNTAGLEYSSKYDHILYTNRLGVSSIFKMHCNCKGSLTSNPLFRNAMRVVWNHDHGMTGHSVHNPFSFSEFRALEEDTRNFLVKIYDYVKEWWRHVAMPFVGSILTYLYEHFGKIILILVGMYSVYKLYNSYATEGGASAFAQDLGGAAMSVGQRIALGTVAAAATSTVVKHAMAPTASPMPSGTPEAPNYFKFEKAKAAPSHQPPVGREGENMDQIGILERKAGNNICFLTATYERPDGMCRQINGRCLAIKNRSILVIRHYIEEFVQLVNEGMSPQFRLSYCVNGKDAACFLTIKQIVDNIKWFRTETVGSTTNYGLLELPKYCPMFKNILPYISTRKQHCAVGAVGHIVAKDYDGQRMNAYGLALRCKEFLIIEGDRHVMEHKVDVCYEYSLHGKGMCGSLLVASRICNGNPGIIGLHVAGCAGNGFAEPIFREMFEQGDIPETVEYILPDLDSIDNMDPILGTNLLLYGTVKEKYAHRESGKTKIVPSLLHGKAFPVKTEPNPLRPNDPRQPPYSHPLRDGCNKHGCGLSKPFPEDILSEVSADNKQVLLNYCQPTMAQVRPLTMQEAVCGSTAIPHCESLNWKSSEGYPLSTLRPPGAHNKKWLFGLEETADGYVLKGVDPLLSDILQMRKRMRAKKQVFPPFYVDCLKDYRLTPEKCKIPGKTRIFSIAPIQVTVDVRRYMGCFLSAYKEGTINAQHGIGINADSIQWTSLAKYLHQVGDNIVTGDYSNYGPSLSSQIVLQVIDDICYWHEINGASPEHIEELRFILENEIANPFHLCGNLVYQTINGIASGSPITAELNSEVNKYYIKCAFLLLARKIDSKLGLTDFNKHCRLVTYGDDLIMSVSDEYINWFNCKTISECLKDYDIILTDITKDGNFVKFRALEDSTFLKRSWKRHPTRPNLYLAPIEIDSVTECLNWCHKQDDMKAATEEVCRACSELAYGWGPEVYDNIMMKLKKAAVRERLQINVPPWIEVDKRNFGE